MESDREPKSGLLSLPTIVTLSDAQSTGRQGTWAACFVTGIMSLVALASILGRLPEDFPRNGWALIDAAIFGLIAWGIYRMSRVAAVAGLVLYIIERIAMHIVMGKSRISGIFITVLFLVMFINAVRGTFAYHRMRNAEKSSP
jgi:nitrate reductase gamma subunit